MREKDQLKQFIHLQLRKGITEAELRPALKAEGGWSDTDLDDIFHSVRSDTLTSAGAENVSPSSSIEPLTQSVPSGDPVPNTTNTPVESAVQKSAFMQHFSKIGIVLLGILVLSGVGYAFFQYEYLTSKAPYTEANLLRGIIEHVGMIESASYRMEGAFAMEDREEDAKPFVFGNTSERALREEAYKRDLARSEHYKKVSSLLDSSFFQDPEKATYPDSLELLYDSISSLEYTPYSIPNTDDMYDPLTKKAYEYRVIDEGAGYELVISFETAEAIDAIKNSFMYDPLTTGIEGKTVTFTGMSGYMYISQSIPKPFLVEMSEQMALIPPETKASISAEVRSVLNEGGLRDWDFIFDTNADLGDMTYKVAGDVRKIGKEFYLRVRNIPGFFLLFLGLEKNVWVKVSPDDIGNDSGGFTLLDTVAEGLPELEEEYVKQKKEMSLYFEKLLTFAEEERLLFFKSKPVLENVGERKLYRYEVWFNKEAFTPFLKKAIAEAEKSGSSVKDLPINDPTLLEYLEGSEFSQMFEYLEKNVSLVLHIDTEGYLAQAEYKLRFVPPDEVTALAKKQGAAKITFSVDDINKPLVIEVPADAVPLKDILKDARDSFNSPNSETFEPVSEVSAQVLSGFKYVLDYLKTFVAP